MLHEGFESPCAAPRLALVTGVPQAMSGEKEMKKRTEFQIEISIENVCRFLDIQKDNPMYEEMLEELEEMLPEAYEKIKPVALLGFGSLDGYEIEEEGKPVTEALFGVYSIGREMGEWSTKLFGEGDYLRGMMADAIADDYLFQMDAAQLDNVVALCRENGKGIVRRVEAPHDIPMSIQKRAYDAVKAWEEGIDIRESFMYDPVKTSCQVYLLDDNSDRQRPEHDCSKCQNLTCKHRNIPEIEIVVKGGEKEQRIRAAKGGNLLQTLREHDIMLAAVCGGRGTCGKCKVRFLQGRTAPAKEDESCFTKEELAQGFRLACMAYPEEDCVIQTDADGEKFFIPVDDRPKEKADGLRAAGEYGIAADIGTTTIAMELVELSGGRVLDVYTAMNRQRAYGADVISRIEASNSGKGGALKKSILEDLAQGVRKLTEKSGKRASRMVISGNTTMIHLLMGYSCETLGVYPFTPVNIGTIHTTYEELFGDSSMQMEIVIFPGISTYVGGDITSGLYSLAFSERERPSLLIDLGTNGEMAIGNREKILVASTAAGPAFEGGNIKCGTGSIPGAVCGVTIREEKAYLTTIGGEKPVGICGTGVVETVYELKKEELMDETGLLDEAWFENGFPLDEERNIRFYQKDIREFQLAKSAVRAGAETLILEYGISYDEIEHIYIAGGFGHQISIPKAVDIGLFPAQCKERIEVAGNTSLKGAYQYLIDPQAVSAVGEIVEKSQEISLSDNKSFQEYYMEYMYFE